jgi:hypothetical protein
MKYILHIAQILGVKFAISRGVIEMNPESCLVDKEMHYRDAGVLYINALRNIISEF